MKNSINAAVRYFVCVGFLFLFGCGGGGGGGGDQSAATPPSAPQAVTSLTAASTRVEASGTVPANVVKAIVTVASPLDSGVLGSSIIHGYTSTDKKSLVIAVDGNKDILLASLVSGSSTALNAESTAQALARLSFGALPQGISAAEFAENISSASSFKNLVAAIEQAHAANVAPLKSELVSQEILNVLGQAVKTVASKPAIGNRTLDNRAQRAAASPSIDPPLPFTIFSGTGALPSVYVTGTGVKVVNGMPIYWAGFSSASPETEVSLPPSTLLRALVGQTSPWLGPNGVIVPDDNGSSVDLTLKQTRATHQQNLTSIYRGMVSLALDVIVPEEIEGLAQCAAKIIDAAISSDKIDEFSAAPSMEVFNSYVVDTALSPTKIPEIVKECLPKAQVDADKAVTAMQSFGAGIAKMLTGFKAISKLNEAASLSAQVAFSFFYWSDPPKTVGVCQSKGNFPRSGAAQVVSCLDTLEVNPKKLVMAVGAKYTPEIKAFGKQKETALPTGLQMNQDSKSFVSISADTGEFTALAVGSTVVTLFDPYTETKAFYIVDVVEPELSPNPLALKVGETGSMQLVDHFGNPVIYAPAITWGMPDPNIVTLDLPSLFFKNGPLKMTGKAAGMATTILTNSVTGKTLTGNINVTDANVLFWRATYQVDFTKCVAPNYASLGTACGTAFQLYGGTSSPKTFYFKTGPSEPFNMRFDDGVFSFGFCTGQTVPDLAVANSFTRPINLNGLFFNDPEPRDVTYTVTSRGPGKISGTFSQSFNYPVPGPFQSSPREKREGKLEGTWEATPRSTSFPKCVYDTSTADRCTQVGQAAPAGGGFNQTCDWKTVDNVGRPGEWTTLPK